VQLRKMGCRLSAVGCRLKSWIAPLAGIALLGVVNPAHAGVLPDDRADVLYHSYDGGGITIDGPSVLVRKKFGETFAAAANYYVDMVSSASIDVQLSASPYEEERTQYSAAFDYLRGKATYSAGFINSEESDYTADTAYLAISQDLFGDLTTISMSFKRGWDDVFMNERLATGELQRNQAFGARCDKASGEGCQLDRRGYAVGLTQVLTRNMIMSASYEVLTDEGFLNNPYRNVRFRDPTVGLGWRQEPEIYPRTRTSNAASARVKYFLPWRGAAEGSYRFFTDTWGIQAHTAEVGYTHPVWHRWTFDAKLRYYRQEAADFYSDLFPREQFANFLARDKELSTFDSITVGVGASYQFTIPRLRWVERSTVNARLDRLMISYEDFRDARLTDPANGIFAGAEPLYELNANIGQLFISIWF
jgi:hypothetical protein